MSVSKMLNALIRLIRESDRSVVRLLIFASRAIHARRATGKSPAEYQRLRSDTLRPPFFDAFRLPLQQMGQGPDPRYL
jgi:hypothetical protein